MATVGGWAPDETVTTASPRLSRMENLLVPTNYFDRIYASTKATEVNIRQIRQTSLQVHEGYHGVIARDPQYQGALDFSTDDGHTFSAPAVGVEGNRIMQVRLSLSQYNVTPPILAYKIDWFLPTGWVWLDGLGGSTYEEAVSNPVVITRPSRSPVNPQPVGFRVLIAQRYY